MSHLWHTNTQTDGRTVESRAVFSLSWIRNLKGNSSRSRYDWSKAKSNRKRNEVLIIQQQIPHLNLFSSAPTRAGNGLGTFYHQLCMELQGKRILLKNKQDFKGSLRNVPRDLEQIPRPLKKGTLSKDSCILRYVLSNIRQCCFHFEFPFGRKWKLIVHLLFMEKALVGKNPWKVVLFIIIHLKQFFLLPGINHWKKESWIDI